MSYRTTELTLSNVSPIPPELLEEPNGPTPSDQWRFNLLRLAHHDFIDENNFLPDDAGCRAGDMAQTLTQGPEFRFRRNGPGTGDRKSSAAERYGRAICRYILSEHFDYVFFANINEVLNEPPGLAWDQYEIRRATSGDMPDYFCGRNVYDVCFAEAKGSRNTAVQPGNQYFRNWLDQFDRVELHNTQVSQPSLRSTKGYLVAAGLTNEEHPRRPPRVTVHDPRTPGEVALQDDGDGMPGRKVIGFHYMGLLRLLSLDPIADALAYADVEVESDFQITSVNLHDGRSFAVGPGWQARTFLSNRQFLPRRGHGFVFGLHHRTLRVIRDFANGQQDALADLPNGADELFGQCSILADGSLFCAPGYIQSFDRIRLGDL